MTSTIFTGCMPALMTPCKGDRSPDFDSLVKKGKELIAAGMSAVIYAGSMGDWPLLTDEERMEGRRAPRKGWCAGCCWNRCSQYKFRRCPCRPCSQSRGMWIDGNSARSVAGGRRFPLKKHISKLF